MKTVPSVSFWGFRELIEARFAQWEAEKRRLEKEPDPSVILIEPDFDVLCDFCNVEIIDDGELLNMVDFGSRIVCNGCYQKHYAKEPIKYRLLREDGSLGGYVK